MHKYHVAISDSDLYKFSMQYAICQIYPRVQARYTFINRDKRAFPDGFAKDLKEIVNNFKSIQLTKNEKDFLREKCSFLSPSYLDFLSGYEYNPDEVSIIQEGTDLQVAIEGPWYKVVLWEVPLMACISELYFEKIKCIPFDRDIRKNLNINKAKELSSLAVGLNCKRVHYVEFGTRRRFSFKNQEEVIQDLMSVPNNTLIGTSNVYLAMKYGLKPLGTQAHEWISGTAALYDVIHANKYAMDNWIKVYQGELGTVLTDTFGSTSFFQDFNGYYARIFDNLRQDSGDPILFAKRAINHYNMLNINPMFKSIMFSDSLNLEEIKRIHTFCEGRINALYGIGTNLTNDVGVKPLNIVIKLIKVNDSYAIKLSDSGSKATGDADTVKFVRKQLKNSQYYVYALLDPRKMGRYVYQDYIFPAEPFYIGKGQGNRLNQHKYSRKRIKNYKNNKIKKIINEGKDIIPFKIIENLTELEALAIEEELIKTIGRISENGPLTNVMPNGSQYPGREINLEMQKKIGLILSKKFKGRILTQEWKDKIKKNNAKYWKGKHLSKEHFNKLQAGRKTQNMATHRVIYEIISPEGIKYIVDYGMEKFCLNHKLHRAKMVQLSTGKLKFYKGWKVTKIAGKGEIQK